MKVMLHCTDKNQKIEADVLNIKRAVFLEVAVNTVKIKMMYNSRTKVYVGNMAGLEFVVKDSDVPDEYRKEWTR